jgi:ParB family chromosome partitioning protein
MSNDKRKALGRGLSALLPGAPSAASAPAGGAAAPVAQPAASPPARREYFICAIEDVHPSGANPRKDFDEEALSELADSLREHGLLQPLLVRQRDGGGFTLIAGERRWKAAQRAGLKDVPVVVKEAADRQAFELALVENVQRRDLNAIEEAEAFRRLADEYGYTQDQIARRVGKDRATVANAFRLLKLPEAVRAMVIDGRLQMGHARALLGLDGDALVGAAEQVVKQGLSVRQTEALAQKLKQPPKPPKPAPEKNANVRDLEQRLQRSVGVPCRIVEKAKDVGKLEIEYANLDELDRVLDKLLRP